jgi:hypothetical protein
MPVPGDQLQPAAPIQDRNDPMAVIFDLVQPIVAFRRPGGGRGYGEADAGWQRRWRGAGRKGKVL